MITLDSVLKLPEEVIFQELDSEAVLLNLRSGVYYGLNNVGARIWSLIQQPRTVAEIRDTILQEYEVEPERSEPDVIALLQKLAGEGLIEIKDETNS